MLCILHPSTSKLLHSESRCAMMSNMTLFLIFVTLGVVTAQTFQYSRGWTNGKRDGHKPGQAGVDKILSPCQILKLKYLLDGKPYNDRLLLTPCDYSDEEGEQKRYKIDHSQETLFDAFQ